MKHLSLIVAAIVLFLGCAAILAVRALPNTERACKYRGGKEVDMCTGAKAPSLKETSTGLAFLRFA